MQRRNRVKDSTSSDAPTIIYSSSSSSSRGDSHKTKNHSSPKIVVGVICALALFLLIIERKNHDIAAIKDSPNSSELKYVDVTHEEFIDTKIVEGVVEDSKSDDARIHVIFSTDCSAYQHWQSYLLFYSALRVKQPGYVTRIASGCSDEEAAEAREWHETHISSKLSNKFFLHLTPHFSGVKGEDGSVVGDYKFFNKPFGLHHWIENGELMGIDESTGEPIHEDDIIILIDPDMVLLRPLNGVFTNPRETITKEKDLPLVVQHGQPIAQLYGLGAQWRKFDVKTITGDRNSPALAVSQNEGNKHYPAGPPYLATAKDMYKIALKWTEFAPGVHAEYPNLLAEMYAYCIAAAHLKLPHVMIESLMVSNTNAGGEGWEFIDRMDGNICEHAISLDHDVNPLPSVIHFCQRYIVGERFFGKRKLPKSFFTCESPFLKETPMDLGDQFFKYPVGAMERRKKGMVQTSLSAKQTKREAFMVCAMTNMLNEASKFFKQNHCGGEANFDYSMDLAAM